MVRNEGILRGEAQDTPQGTWYEGTADDGRRFAAYRAKSPNARHPYLEDGVYVEVTWHAGRKRILVWGLQRPPVPLAGAVQPHRDLSLVG